MDLNKAIKLIELQQEQIQLLHEKICLLEGINASQLDTIHELQDLCNRQQDLLDRLTEP